ncbi:MAG: T9SS type A sorting domain-containing protein [Calditrichia bacterium]
MKKFLLAGLFLLLPLMANSATIVVSQDITSNTTWTANNEYHLNGLIFVDSLVTLTIQPGTVIKGYLQSSITTGDGASALVVRRGAKLLAEGQPDSPIVFTSELDDLNDPFDLGPTDRGLWGGLILLGQATTNQPDTSKNQIEGIPPSENARYGGNNDADNSGSLSFISIRHGGFSISGVPGDEINGLTMGAVGSGTSIHHIEVFANFDDGYEWFGGTVNTKNLVAAFCADDAFDYDQGFRGKGQFWFAVQADDEAGRGGEHDGGDDDETGQPYSIPVISNVTYIGAGVGSTPAGDGNDRALYFRDNAGGKYYNSIFTDFVNVGVKIEDLPSGDDSRIRMDQGDLLLQNNIWWAFGAGNTLSAISSDSYTEAHLSSHNNLMVNPQISHISRDVTGMLDPRPSASGPAATGALPMTDPFFSSVNYYGAFDPGAPLWTRGWTALAQEQVTGIHEIHHPTSVIPAKVSLSRNYPNPFNPTTTIQFELPESGLVQLSVYNILGEKVAALVDGHRSAGAYTVTWNAERMSSGVYFYRLETGSGIETRRMLLMK